MHTRAETYSTFQVLIFELFKNFFFFFTIFYGTPKIFNVFYVAYVTDQHKVAEYSF